MNFDKIVEFINSVLLKLAMLPAKLYQKMGVNTFQLFCILKTKLIIDNRQPLAFRSMGRQRNKANTNSSMSVVFMSLFSGLFFLFAFTLHGIQLQLTMYFSFIIFMLASILISDFTAVLIDVRDNLIILPKPVNDRTIVLSRLLHIFLHLFKIILPMMLPGAIAITVMYGPIAVVAFCLMILFCTLFTVFLINLVYILILKLAKPSMFKSILSYIQILLAVVVYGSYQFVPKMMANLQIVDTTHHPIIYFLPPFWFATAVKTCTTLSGSINEVICSVTAIIVPIIALYLTIKFLAPSFNNKLNLVNAVSDTGNTANKLVSSTTGKDHSKRKSYSEIMATLLTRDKVEQMGFLFCWKMGNRSKDFIMKVYPSFGYVLVLAIVMLFNNKHLHTTGIGQLSLSDPGIATMVIGIIYFSGYILFSVITQICFSERYKASWLFYTTPIKAPGKILAGTYKSIMAKFYLPIATILTILALYFFGWRLLPNLFLGFSNIFLAVAINYNFGTLNFPFSIFQDKSSGGSKFMTNMFKLLFCAILGVFHYFIFKMAPIVWIFLALSLIGNWMVLDTIKKVSWEKMLANQD